MPDPDPDPSLQQPPDTRSVFGRYIRPNLYLLILTLCFIVGGVVYANTYFQGLSTFQATMGGLVIGLFGTLCAACHTVIWKR